MRNYALIDAMRDAETGPYAMARDLGIARSCIGRYVHDGKIPRADRAILIAMHLGKQVEDLWACEEVSP